MRAVVGWLDRFQVPLYLAALAIGAAFGLCSPAIIAPAGAVLAPALGLLLYATFCGVPFGGFARAIRDWRFLVAILLVNFVVAPVVAYALSRVVAHDRALLAGVLLVLLTPCVDYVIVFTGLAGGAKDRLLVSAPILMLGQMLLLPLFLQLLGGTELAAGIDLAPFAEAFLLLILAPLAAAGVTQLAAARSRWGAALLAAVTSAMVPLMMLTLLVVVASQIAAVGARAGSLLVVIPVYALFAAVMVPLGIVVARLARIDGTGGRAVVLSGVTRNSLVVLPLALALPAAFDLAPLAVVTQTLVELLVLILLVRLIPRLVPDGPPRSTSTP